MIVKDTRSRFYFCFCFAEQVGKDEGLGVGGNIGHGMLIST